MTTVPPTSDPKLVHWIAVRRWAISIGCCRSCANYIAFCIVDRAENLDSQGREIRHCEQVGQRRPCRELWTASWATRPRR